MAPFSIGYTSRVPFINSPFPRFIALRNFGNASGGTVKSASNGYHIHGKISCKTLESCDRCLNTYENKKKILLDIILSNNFELTNNTDIIFFKDSEDFIDLGPVIHDLILLDSPFKQLCADNCKVCALIVVRI